jgi:cyclopropane fatty-acyl-phospholipid synthase-like methyltransferase
MTSQPVTNPTAVYDRVTESWRLLLGEDLHYGYFTDAAEPLASATAGLTRLMADWAALRSDLEVLDVGCGIGAPARFLASQYRCRVTGISTSKIGLERAAALTEAQGLDDRISFLEADGMRNGLPDSSFDRVWILESSHLMPRKGDLMSEASRVLRPGGRLVLCDIILRGPVSLPELIRDLPRFQLLDAVFGKAKMDTLETYSNLARENGLAVERTEDISLQTLPTFDRWRSNAYANRVAVIEMVGETYWKQFIEACDWLTVLWQSGKFGYGIICARKAA